MTTVVSTDSASRTENPPESLIKQMAPWDWVALIIPGLVLSPLLNLQCIFLLEREHMQFFPLAFAAVGYFFYTEGRSDSIIQVWNVRRWFATASLFASYSLAAFSLAVISPMVAQASLVLCIFTWGVGRFGNLTVLRVFGICGLIAVTVPPPFGLDKSMVTGLQSLSSTICSRLMDATGILHLQRGNVIEITSKPLFVEEACSGVDSQYALMAVAGVLLLLAQTSFVVSAITIVTVPIWAIMGNLLRIYSIVIGLEYLNIDLSVGLKHTILGLFSFAGAAYAHWSSVQFLNFLQMRYFESPSGQTAVESVLPQDSVLETKSVKSSDLSIRWLYILPVILLVLSPMGMWGWYNHFLIKLPSISEPIANAMPGEKDLPKFLAGSTRVSFSTSSRHERNALGQHSHTWNYHGNNGYQTVSFDFPFRGFHPLWECYTNSGWTRVGVKEVTHDSKGNPLPWTCYEVQLRNQEGEFGTLHFGFFDELGKIYNHDGPIDEYKPNRTAVNFIELISKPIRDLDAPLLFQIQVFSKSELPLAEPQIQNQREMFLILRERLIQKSIPVLESVRQR